ncbi:transporter substrate-binding domain-containing protein [Bacillus salipaludis]|uniref:Transporter substrate-binding domain-containing protein n=1 Tax=Bacillus salipaludis TaxID=2547811 RepID=A0A4R5VQK3_9BACI|nr:transporter substrate-binding domain-containing protein [Bacillus salipaludis]TDK59875.1 transporter substrate-binding domain-containing protein [Bacillus salipaludis]
MNGKKVIILLIMVWLFTSNFSVAEATSSKNRNSYENIYEKYSSTADSFSSESIPLTDDEIEYLDNVRKKGLKVPNNLDSMGGFYEFKNNGNEYGVNKLFYSTLEKVLGVKLSYVAVSSSEDVINKISNGSLDLSPIIQRRTVVYPEILLSEPISINMNFIFYSNDKKITDDTLVYTLAGKKVGILNMIDDNSQSLNNFSDIKYYPYKDLSAAYDALKNNKIDFIYSNVGNYRSLIDHGLLARPVPNSRTYDTYRVITSSSNPLLLSILNKAISIAIGPIVAKYEKEMQKAYLYNHFPMTEKEKEFIRSIGKVRVMVDDNFAPLSFYDKAKGKYSGASVELFENIAHLIGLDYIFIRDENLSWSEKVNKVKEKNIDLLFPISITETRQKFGLFSHPYVSTYYSVIAKADNPKKIKYVQELLHKKVGIVKGTSITDFIETIIPKEQITYFDSDRKMYLGLKNRDVDYIIQNENVFLEDFYENELFDLTSVYRIKESPKYYCYFFKQTGEMDTLVSIMNRAMNYFDTNDIVDKYKVGESELRNRYITQKRHRNLITFILLIVLIVLSLFVFGFIRTKKVSKKLEKEVAINEMAYLQSQIKPHFLYNALSAIMAFCYTDSEKAGELLNSLSKYLRIVFNTDNRGELVTLQREIELVKSYVDIEEARYGERLQTIFEIDETCLQQRIMPLMIQPLVENAIRHGVVKKTQGGTLKLTVQPKGESIKVTVTDDGVGMSEQKIKEILSRKGTVFGVGLANIHQRLGHIADTKLTIESREGYGTIITLYLPFKKNT